VFMQMQIGVWRSCLTGPGEHDVHVGLHTRCESFDAINDRTKIHSSGKLSLRGRHMAWVGQKF
jgi:hypothetical protein